MSSVATSLVVFAGVFGSALFGMYLRSALPAPHLSADSKDVVRIAMGLVGTMAALVLGLLVGSAKANYDAQRNELIQMSANVMFLDSILAHYGPEANGARSSLRSSVRIVRDRMWSNNHSVVSSTELTGADKGLLYDKVQQLSPKDSTQNALRAEALAITVSIGQTRCLLFEQGSTAVPMTMLVIVVFWLATIFVSFGLFAPRNLTVVMSMAVAALSVSGAVLLILEMYKPFEGLIHISNAPFEAAFRQLFQ